MNKFLRFSVFLQLFFVFSLITQNIFAQNGYTQTIRGTVIDKFTNSPLPGANVVILDTAKQRGTITNNNGEFRFDNIPVGRHTIMVSFIGYKPEILRNIYLKSGKELVRTIELEEKVYKTQEVVVKADARKDIPINEMAAVSARSFSVEETERFAGSMGDPSRMAANYAGVVTAGDTRNDIIIRGNSPLGLLWRLNGINIPNPNHFGALGSTGGPVSMLNNNLLTNSDFFTGAFPAEYGNAISGAFDLRMRTGNNEKREHVGQVGFNGFELGTEGPFRKGKRASYLINYRYSVLDLIDKLGVAPRIGATPEYQDLSFNMNFPDTKLGRFTIFGVGGLSNIDLLSNRDSSAHSYDTPEGTNTYNGSDMGFVAVSNVYFFNRNTSLKTNASLSGTRVYTNVDTLGENDVPGRMYAENNKQYKISFSTHFSKKFNAKNNLEIGCIAENFHIAYRDSFFDSKEQLYIYQTDVEKGNIILWQNYIQWQHKFNDILTLYTGLHHQHLFSNNTFSVEPRFSIKWKFKPKQALSLGYGLHSQTQPLFMYYIQSRNSHTNTYFKTNLDLEFSYSHHAVLSYDYLITPNFRVKAETYYQYLFNIPVTESSSYFSLVNYGAGFHQIRVDSLVNEGTGKNYGIELTLEKFFTDNYYFLVTGSFFDSKYTASDGKERNTAFNGNFVINALGGYEFVIGRNKALSINNRLVYAGGRRTRYIDLERSRQVGEVRFDHSKTYSERVADYLRWDIRIGFKLNGKRVTQEWALDIQNVTNHDNVFSRSYDEDSGNLQTNYQTGFFPMMLYRINF